MITLGQNDQAFLLSMNLTVYNMNKRKPLSLRGICLLEGWFSWFIVLWTVILLGLMSIGGYFMFRKFLKRLPKEDGMSILDWEEHYINKTRHLWADEQKTIVRRACKSCSRTISRCCKIKDCWKNRGTCITRKCLSNYTRLNY